MTPGSRTRNISIYRECVEMTSREEPGEMSDEQKDSKMKWIKTTLTSTMYVRTPLFRIKRLFCWTAQ